MRDGKAYLSPVMDLCGNKIVSWSVKKNQGMGLINEMLDGLFEQLPEGAEPLLHSDSKNVASRFCGNRNGAVSCSRDRIAAS